MRKKLNTLFFTVLFGSIVWLVISAPHTSAWSGAYLLCIGCLTLIACLTGASVFERAIPGPEEKGMKE